MSMTKEQLVKGFEALEVLVNEQVLMAKDAFIFLHDKGMWEEFMTFHCSQHVERHGNDRR